MGISTEDVSWVQQEARSKSLAIVKELASIFQAASDKAFHDGKSMSAQKLPDPSTHTGSN